MTTPLVLGMLIGAIGIVVAAFIAGMLVQSIFIGHLDWQRGYDRGWCAAHDVNSLVSKDYLDLYKERCNPHW